MVERLKRIASILIILVLVFQMVGCGTIFYPERKGQISGRIDPVVAVADAIGLLFFIIPGVIAFAVDFSTGAIYLPSSSRSSLDINDLRHVKFDPEQSDVATIEKIIKEETGYDVKLDGDDVRISELKSTDDMMMRFAEVMPEIENSRASLAMK